jgi:hypothetical protein
MTLTITAEVISSIDAPTVRLVATSTAIAPSAVPNNTLIDVWRVHTDGSRHRVLTDDAPRLIGGGWAWLDMHAPFNQAITYEVDAAGAVATSGAVWVVSDRVWLIHSSQASLAVLVDGVLKIDNRSVDTRSAKFTPIGGKSIFLTEGTRDGIKGSITLRVTDEAPLQALFADDAVILINTPGTKGWDIGWLWVQPGQLSYDNPANLVPYKYRHLDIPFEEAAEPDVDAEPLWTSGDAEAYWTTGLGVDSAGVGAHYADCLAFLTDTRLS